MVWGLSAILEVLISSILVRAEHSGNCEPLCLPMPVLLQPGGELCRAAEVGSSRARRLAQHG